MDSPTTTHIIDNLNLPPQELINYIMTKTDYDDPDFVAASVVAARYDDPSVPQDILDLLASE
jgi:hypothetical protein